MKVRSGFVSNSSSASFIINKYDLSQRQIDALLNYKNPDMEFWIIDETDYSIRGVTSMDNGDMEEYFKQHGIDEKYVQWFQDNICPPDKPDCDMCNNGENLQIAQGCLVCGRQGGMI